jgi:hypothetical protein
MTPTFDYNCPDAAISASTTRALGLGRCGPVDDGGKPTQYLTTDRVTKGVIDLVNAVKIEHEALWTNLAQTRTHPSKANPKKLVASLSYQVAMRRCSSRCPMKHSIRDRSA